LLNVVIVGAAMAVGDVVVGASSIVVLAGSGGRAVVDTALVGVVKYSIIA